MVFYVTSVVFKMDFDHLTYQVASPLMAAGFLCLPLHEPFSIIGTAVHQSGYPGPTRHPDGPADRIARGRRGKTTCSCC